MSEQVSDVRKVNCIIQSDDTYKCDITSGAYKSWFAKCMGERMKTMTNVRGRSYDPNAIKHMFMQAARACRGGQRDSRWQPEINIEGKRLDAPVVTTYFLKDIHFGKGIKDLKIGKKSIKIKGRLVCYFDENTDKLICEK